VRSVCYVDGDIGEWRAEKPVISGEHYAVYAKADEKYAYLLVRTDGYDFERDTLYLPIDTIGGQGNLTGPGGLSFERPADFLIQIKGDGDSRILVDAYYDSFYYMYGEQLAMIEKQPQYGKKGSGLFNPMYHCLSREIYLPQDKKTVPFMQYETGLLRRGDANPSHEDYNSLTDFAFKEGSLELRIPWQLLNFMDPSTKTVMGDLYLNKGFSPEKTPPHRRNRSNGLFYLGRLAHAQLS